MSGVKSYMQWRDLSYKVTLDSGKEKQLLNKTFGYVRPGIMCALMGASGAGNNHNTNTVWPLHHTLTMESIAYHSPAAVLLSVLSRQVYTARRAGRQKDLW